MAAAAAEGSVPEEPIDVASVDIEPNQCPLESPLSVGIRFRSKVAIGNPSWTCQYLVDIAHKRHVIELGTFRVPHPYQVGDNSFEFHVDKVDVSIIKKKHLLNNVGLLTLSLMDGADVVVSIKIVTQVAYAADGETLQRTMFNPLQ
ncbi:Uncharacterized protein PBTT_07634 [Plasmodiophora brassicae]|uniref:Uncharacterized protein n=1 Tax=Plasmodiophora brassicae TaxID=37360 RepID=A0A0G4IM44_PLABS|nr:hypothetical protein PBRA_004924 [Plasmodiophora brassicae]